MATKHKLEYIWLDGNAPTQQLRSKMRVETDFSGKVEDPLIEGSLFTVSLPRWERQSSIREQDKTEGVPPQETGQSRPRVLLIDDDEDICEYFQYAFVNQFYMIVEKDPSKGLELLTRDSFDLVITDLMMKDVDGKGILQAAWGKLGIPVVVVTGAALSQQAIDELRELGAFDVLKKPFENIKAMLNCFHKAIDTHTSKRKVS